MRVIQIAASEAVVGGTVQGELDEQSIGTLYALAEDGSIWIMLNPWEDERRWRRLPNVGEDGDATVETLQPGASAG
jgi:hypothetical protein